MNCACGVYWMCVCVSVCVSVCVRAYVRVVVVDFPDGKAVVIVGGVGAGRRAPARYATLQSHRTALRPGTPPAGV